MTSPDATVGRRIPARAPVRTVAAATGALFLFLGVLGFVPGVTADYDTMRDGGPASGALLFGVFQVSVLHNLWHLMFGFAGLAMSRTITAARAYLLGGGAAFAALWLYGVLVDHDSQANFLPVNTAANRLHLLAAVTMLGLGARLARSRSGRRVSI